MIIIYHCHLIIYTYNSFYEESHCYTVMGESVQDFEADFPQKVSLKMLN